VFPKNEILVGANLSYSRNTRPPFFVSIPVYLPDIVRGKKNCAGLST
jgi:hypothetical protein